MLFLSGEKTEIGFVVFLKKKQIHLIKLLFLKFIFPHTVRIFLYNVVLQQPFQKDGSSLGTGSPDAPGTKMSSCCCSVVWSLLFIFFLFLYGLAVIDLGR